MPDKIRTCAPFKEPELESGAFDHSATGTDAGIRIRTLAYFRTTP